jgi:hypothetical protein
MIFILGDNHVSQLKGKHMLLGIVGLVVGFVAGVLVGRRNKSAVEAAVAEAKVDLAKAQAEAAALKAKI